MEMEIKNGGTPSDYLMENEEEAVRLELKTDQEAVKRQAAWAGIGPGMRVLDVGCGTGITTNAISELVGETGAVVGLDFSSDRISLARNRYTTDRVSFVEHDINQPYLAEEPFDAVWSRFFLEYFKSNQLTIISNAIASLRLGGIACLADLDNNSLGHSGLSVRLLSTLEDIALLLETDHNFDIHAGRRLYGHLYTLGFTDLAVTGEMHHLFYGQTSQAEQFNWIKKMEVVAEKSGCTFSAYEGDYGMFREEFQEFLDSPMRFTYTPLIIARGIKSR